MEEYLGALGAERGLSPHTVSAYRTDLVQYARFLVEHGPSSPEAVSGFVQQQRERGLAPATIARKVAAIRGYHRFLVIEELAVDDPTVLLEAPGRGRSLPKALTVDEAARLVEAPNQTSLLGSRDRALLEFLYATGCRVSEAVGLDIIDLDLETRSAIVTGKGDKQRIVPMGRHAVAAIEHYLPVRRELIGSRRDPGRLFVNARGGPLTRQGVWQIVRKHARATQIADDRISPHVLRHSAATHMVEGGADLRTVQEMLGHASISTTQVYTRVSPQHLLEVFVTSHPREVSRASERPGGHEAR
jgi:integrase/recombinase XerD